MEDLLRTADQNMYIDKNRKKQGGMEDRTHFSAGRHSFPAISEETLIAKIESMLHTHRSYLLVVNDIENFHFINDTFGYQMGNQVLDDFYQKMREMKEILFVCRYHSDIFLSVTDITDIGEETALKITQDRCRRIAEALSSAYPIGNCVIDTGACRMEEGELSAEEYISRANLACHSAKKNYGHLCYYTEEMAAAAFAQCLARAFRTSAAVCAKGEGAPGTLPGRTEPCDLRNHRGMLYPEHGGCESSDS